MAAPESEKREIPPPPPSTIKKLPRYPKGLAGAREIRTPEGVAQRQTSVKGVHSPYPEQAFPTDSSRFQLPHAKGFCRANLALSSLLQTVIHSSAFRLVIQRASHGSASDDRVPGPDTRFLVHQHPGPLLRDRNGSTSIKSGSLRSVQAQRGPEEKAKMRPNNTHTQAGPLSRNACVNQDSDTRFQALPDLTPALWALADWKTAGMRNPRSHAQDPPPDIPRRVLSSTSRAAVCLAEISCWSFLKEARSRCADLVDCTETDMSDSKQGKALARQRQRRRDEEIFPRRRRPDPVPLSFPQILRRAAAVSSSSQSLRASLASAAPLSSTRAYEPSKARLNSSSPLGLKAARPRAARGQDAPVQRRAVAMDGRAADGSQQRLLRTAPADRLSFAAEISANEQVVTLAAFRAARASPDFSYLDCPCTFLPEVKVACERCSDFRAGVASVMDFFSSAVLIGAPKEGTHFAWSTRFGQSSEPEQE
ncbi:hypothetical protein C6P46_003392 [Rhodotorula mucilaginosa]|uniref:Uncharacterized protein n=1 Tax=Rhodotorula mucilaginosa TaxID=5537 RepID=A0A9P6VT90_RHOMI|nr:hypothetical protein C6P46_003392 [Rhodotorula mucilaginosa]